MGFGGAGIVLYTTNFGTNWEYFDTGIRDNIYATYFINRQIGFAVGDNGIIYKTINGCLSW
ncbi:MAG: hypothetical protein N3A61_09720 [Ignavibacteria bacterium]|nr:hypothetical protein [Ignavibacteria bacterium]